MATKKRPILKRETLRTLSVIDLHTVAAGSGSPVESSIYEHRAVVDGPSIVLKAGEVALSYHY
jgi:hypothetical protein